MLHHLRRATGPVLAASGLTSRARALPDLSSSPDPVGPPTTALALGELASGLASIRLVAALGRLSSVPRGDGHVVVDIPGWQAPEVTGAPLRAYLRRIGYDARGWGLGTNRGDPRRDVDRLTERVLRIVDEGGAPVSLVGWSLGGVIAREVARQHPDAVRRVITYGTPVVGGPTYTTIARAYRDDGTAGRVARRLDAERPIQTPLTVLFSRRDGIVSWQACIDRTSPLAEHVEVSSTHLGMGTDPDVWTLVAERLAGNTPPAGE